jgi:hypothetical protein
MALALLALKQGAALAAVVVVVDCRLLEIITTFCNPLLLFPVA